MNHDYMLPTYDFGSSRLQTGTTSSTYYDPLPIQLGYTPRTKFPSQSATDDLSLIDRAFSDTIPSGSSPHPYSSLLTVLRWWIPELIASICSIAALLVIVVVLRIYDGRSIDNLNLPKGLTLNGLVAAIAAFDRVFLVLPIGSALSQEAWLWFRQNDGEPEPQSRLRDLNRSDAASRGAWGSFWFIFTSPRRYLSLFGAILSVLSLAITTFTQQLIVIKNISVHDQTSSLQPGNVPRTEYYNLYIGNPAEAAITPTMPMTAAIYAGMMEPETDPASANCPSGNCTWPDTPTLAVCGGCASITPQHTACNETFCNYTMPSGSVFELTNFKSTDEGIGFQTMSTHGQHWKISDDDYLYIANFDMMGAPYNSFGEFNLQEMYQASECALWMCVNTYSTSVGSGKQTQKLVSSFHKCDQEMDGANYTFTYPNTTAGASKQNHTIYNVDQDAIVALYAQFDGENLGNSMLNGTAIVNIESAATTSDPTSAIWSGTQDQQKWIKNLALSMTNIVRTNNQQRNSIYDGSTFVQGIQVDWWWLSLPIVAVGGSIILLVIVMVRTARSDLNAAWKGSPLAFLFLYVDEDIRRALADAKWTDTTISGIDQGVGGRRMTLRSIGGGRWKFKGVHDSRI